MISPGRRALGSPAGWCWGGGVIGKCDQGRPGPTTFPGGGDNGSKAPGTKFLFRFSGCWVCVQVERSSLVGAGGAGGMWHHVRPRLCTGGPPKTRTGRDEARTLPRLAARSGEGLGIKASHEGPPVQRHPNCLGNSLCNSWRERNSASF